MKYPKSLRLLLLSPAILVLSILYGGFITVIALALLAGILNTFGFEQFQMFIWHNMELPAAWSIPFAIVVSALLAYLTMHVKRALSYLLSLVK
ncbi:hypothetical protein SAMN05421663_102148 [Terribacillus halophilus]|uniref:Uncharacterized protein n=1 Tax=Terribacillus halophilus TaxID=361279 RepID=A0A1G6KW99_9BACI|nr:hypothetical protein [Terribacillus halophilus]SDC34745.1 hypothetical protein SAMN05421663_102148 [Terribacillus halophilus]